MILEHNSQEIFFRSPFGAQKCGETVTIRLAAKNAGLPHSVKLILKNEMEDSTEYISMYYVFTILDTSIYEAKITMPEKETLLWYCFEVKNDKGTYFYGNNSELLGGLGEMYNEFPSKSFQITVYQKDYKTPDWFSESIVYQIFPDRFCNANDDGTFLGDRNDIIKRNWGDQPYYKAEQFGGEYLANDFFGGNLEGIIKKLPYLESLGISAIYLNPIFKAYSNHKYDTGNYEEIDEMFGDTKTFQELCKLAEKKGIRIILDGVFNHTGSNSKYFNKNNEYDSIGAYNSKESPYYDWFSFSEYPDKYDSWWGMLTLPSVNEKSESLRDYLLRDKDSIIKRWLKAGASGWRLDVVDELPDFFVKELREAVKSVKEDAVIIGEVWEDASNKESYGQRREYFLGYELDSVMNYPLKNALIDVACENISAKTFSRRIMSLYENYPKQAFHSLLNMMSSHDSERIITMLGDAPRNSDRDFQSGFKLDKASLSKAINRLRTVIGTLMLLPGVPCIFYGDEIGIQGYGDPFCRSTFDWERVNDENEALKIYKRFIALRKSTPCFSKGDFKPVYTHENTFGFLRTYKDEKYIILVNYGKTFDNIRLDISAFCSKTLKNIEIEEQIYTSDGIFYIGIPAHEVTIYKLSD